MAKLFVSYSRKDSVAARKLVEGFRSMDQEVWVDWEDIPLAADWLNQIFTGIEEADVFVFLISPDSISSEVCKVEISRAVSNHKRIIPIVLRDVNPKDTIEEIRKLNWTFIRETDNFEEGLAKVKTAIELDLDWLEEHRRLQVRALEWHRKKDTSLLLRGRDLRNAEHMLKTYTSRDPIPTDLQRKYIEFSQRTERTRNIVLVVTGVTLIIMIVLTFIAVNNSNEAQRMTVTAQANEFRASTNADLFKQQRVTAEANKVLADNNAATARAEKSIAEQERQKAQAQRSAARAQIYQSRPGELYTSILFAIDSMQKYRTDEAEEVLRKNISMLPLPVAPQISKQRNINDLAYNLKGDTFATASADGTTCAWNTISGEELFCTPAGQPVNAVAFSPDGSLIITGDQSGIVQILDAGHQGNVLHRYQRVKPKAGQGNVKVADVKDGLGGNEPLSAETPVRVVGFSPDGKQVAVAYEDKQIPVFNWDTGNITASLATGTRPNVFGSTRNGSQLVAGSEGGSITFWNLRAKGDSITPSDHKGGAVAIAFSRDNSKVATAGNDNRVVIISPKERKQLLQILTQSTVRDLAFSPDGSWLFTGADDHRARVWDVENGKELLSMSHDGAVSKVAVSPNGQWLATTSEDRTTRIWDRTTGSQIFQIPLRDSGAAVAFSSDGRYLVSADKSGAINIWDLSLLGVRQQWLPFRRAASNVQYSPSGEWIAYSSEDLVWLIKLNPETGEISQQSPLDLKSSVQHLVFSPDSKFVGLSMEGNEIAIYNVENRSLRTAKVPIGIQSIAFSPNNQQFIASDGKGNVQVWDLSGDLLTPNT
ncbi:MAG: TIR domain-containing protein, partial [Syntrophothermus sp.]